MSLSQKVDSQMTSMIDIVFQLLAFFIMTLKIIDAEGDFSIRMPQAGTDAMTTPPTVPLHVRLARAEADGCSITIDGREVANFHELRAEVMREVGSHAGPEESSDLEVELDCDFDLSYEHAIRAITSVSGYRQGDRVHNLIDRIKFARPRSQPHPSVNR